MITNIKVALLENANIGIFAGGVARFTTARTAQVVNSETYLPDYLVSVANIVHSTDIKYKGNIEQPVRWSFAVADPLDTIKAMVGTNYSLTGAKVEVRFESELHVFFVEAVELGQGIATLICTNQQYLTTAPYILANATIKVSASDASFGRIHTSILAAGDYSPCVFYELCDTRNTSGSNYFGVRLLSSSSVDNNYITLRSRYNAALSDNIGKPVRVLFSNRNHVVGGTLESVTIDPLATEWAYIKVTGTKNQYVYIDTTPDLDTLTMATLETNVAVFPLPSNVVLPVTIQFGEKSYYIEADDPRYNAVDNTVSITLEYSNNEYRYINAPMTFGNNLTFANGYRARYYPDFESYKIYDEWDNELWGAEPAYSAYEEIPVDTAKVRDYIQDPTKSVTIYNKKPLEYNYDINPTFYTEVAIWLNDDIKKQLVYSEKWGVGFNIRCGRALGTWDVRNDGGYYWLQANARSLNIGVVYEQQNGAEEPHFIAAYTQNSLSVEKYSRYIEAPSGYTTTWRPESDTLWIDLKPEEMYLADYISLRLFMRAGIEPTLYPNMAIDWIGLIAKDKALSEADKDADILISNTAKGDLVQMIYSGTHGVPVSGTGKTISYGDSNVNERKALEIYTTATQDLATERSGIIYHNPLTPYQAVSATPITAIIEGSISSLEDVDIMDFCNLPTFSYTNTETLEKEEITLDLSTDTYIEGKSVIYKNPRKYAVSANAQALWTKAKASKTQYGLEAPQAITLYGGDIVEALQQASDFMDYAPIRRKVVELKVPYQGLYLGQRVYFRHPKIHADYDLFGTIEKISINPHTGETALTLLCDMMKGADTLNF